MPRSHFWNLYARVYDALRQLIPYDDMLEGAARALKVQPGDRILDLGCGTGNLSLRLAQAHPDCHIVGVDSATAMLERARVKAAGTACTFVAGDLERPLDLVALGGRPFEAIAATNVLYALTEPDQALRRFAAVARPGAIMVQSTPCAGARPGAILSEHLRQARQRGRRGHTPSLVGALILVRVFNALILQRQRQGAYHFPSQRELELWYEQSGWRITSLTRTYAGQNWQIIAERTEE